MRYLGKLRRMLVQHDNTGANPAWHLFKVVVTCTKDNAVTVFVCNEWIRSEVSCTAHGLQSFRCRTWH